jgi:dephospho-CoA kinase
MKTIGITGGVGSGKSAILDFLKENCNCEIIIADILAKDLCKRGEVCFEPLVNLLSEKVLNEDGEIDRSLMAEMIFKDDDLRLKVNAIIHPAVKEYIINRIDSLKLSGTKDFLFLEAALLLDDGYQDILDEIWYIYADRNVRIERLKESRGYSLEKILDIMDSQLSEEDFRNNTDFTIDNSGDLCESLNRIKERLSEYGC